MYSLHPTGTVLYYHSSVVMILLLEIRNYSGFFRLLLILIFLSSSWCQELLHSLASTVNMPFTIFCENLKTIYEHHTKCTNFHLEKDAGFHEVCESSSIKLEVIHKPTDKWRYGRNRSGNYHHGSWQEKSFKGVWLKYQRIRGVSLEIKTLDYLNRNSVF